MISLFSETASAEPLRPLFIRCWLGGLITAAMGAFSAAKIRFANLYGLLKMVSNHY
jgi:hypothetical protein